MNPAFVRRCDCARWDIIPANLNQGVCRLNPPTAFLVQTNQGVQIMSAQPTTDRNIGCSQGQVKVELAT